MRRAVKKSAVALLGAAVLGTAACSGGSGSGATGTGKGQLADGRTFTMSVGSAPGSLDPAGTVLSVAIGINRFLYDPLIHLDQHGKPIAGLAAKWTADTEQATFTLRPGITCPDGSPLTATDVARNIDYIGDPKNKSPLAGIRIMPGTKAKADDRARTVTVTSGAPDAFLLTDAGSVPIVCGKGLKNRKLLEKGGQGTGMFTVAEAVPGDHYTLTRRKDYTWGPGKWRKDRKGLPDRVRIKVVSNETTAANLLLSGQLNATSITGPEQKRLNARKLFHVDQEAPVGELFYNQRAGHPGRDDAVRRALTQALDLNDLGKVLTSGNGKPSTGMVTIEPKVCTGDPVTGNLPKHDLAAAKAALDQAGWRRGPGGVRAKDGRKLSLTLIHATQLGPTMAAGAELVQKAWQSIGVQVELKPVDSPGLNEAYFKTGDWDASMGPVGVSAPSQLIPFFSGPEPPEGTNFGGVVNKQYQAGTAKAAGTAGAAGCPQWAEAEAALIKQVDAVPFYNSSIPTYGQKATFTLIEGAIEPGSIRMYAG